MERMRARRTFWADDRVKDGRRMIRRGETFETNKYHATELQRRGIAAPLPENGPAEVQVQQPGEQPAAGPSNTQEYTPQETGQASRLLVPADIDGLSYQELKEQAKRLEIPKYNTMKKADLITELKNRVKGDS